MANYGRLADAVGTGGGFRSSAANLARRQRAMEDAVAGSLGPLLGSPEFVKQLPPEILASLQSGSPGAELQAVQHLLRQGNTRRNFDTPQVRLPDQTPTPAQLAAEQELAEFTGPMFMGRLRHGSLTSNDILREAARGETPISVQVDRRLTKQPEIIQEDDRLGQLIRRLGIAAGVAAGGAYGGRMLGQSLFGEE